MQKLLKFLAREDGAVTVDWVVLTAAIVGLGLAVISQIGGATTNVGTGIGSYLTDMPVGYDAGGD